MKSRLAGGFAVVLVAELAFTRAHSQDSAQLALKEVIPLPGVAGRIDHMDIDLKTDRVFVAALQNNTLEVAGLQEGKLLRTLRGFSAPQGVLFLPGSNRLYVTCGGDGSCAILDGTTLERVKTISQIDDADNIRYSGEEKLVYVGYGEGGVAAIDPAKAEMAYRIGLPAHPESFQIESADHRMYVNIPGDRKIVVVDMARQETIARWPVKDAQSNFPMAIDETSHRVFVGCRAPARLLVLDGRTGASITSLPIGKDVDDVFFDAGRHRLYASCGEGVVNVISQKGPDTYSVNSTVTTRRGARTSLFIPESNVLIVAVPASGHAAAELRVYSITGR